MMFPVQCELQQSLLENLVCSEHRRLEQELDEIARNGHGRSQRETELKGLEPEQLYAMCEFAPGVEQVIMKSGFLAGVESLGMPAHLPSLFGEKQSQRGLLAWLEIRACRRRAWDLCDS